MTEGIAAIDRLPGEAKCGGTAAESATCPTMDGTACMIGCMDRMPAIGDARAGWHATPANRTRRLGRLIRRAREAKGDSQEALAFHAGITTGTLQRLELGHSDPAWSTVRAVARALDLSLRELAAAVESAREGS